ncbi:MAG: hypothetical protein GKR90_14305 [Pseudomonadales bacterium]|nr:hypothetical protein [Pseudomonadales bacterium]
MVTFVLAVSVSLPLHAKQEIVLIEIRGDSLATPIEISDPRIIIEFSVWNGPGVVSSDGEGRLNPPAYLDPDREEGRFIDWPRGIVGDKPVLSNRFDVTLYLGKSPNQRLYPFTYATDSVSNQGFIFLPLASTAVILHGVEDNWFYASEQWDELITPRITAAME